MLNRTIVDALRENAEGPAGSRTAITFIRSDRSETSCSYENVWREAVRRAAFFRALGVRRSDRVALALPEPDDFVLSFFGVLVAGAVPVPVYPPMTLSRLDAYLEALGRIVAISGAKRLLTVPKNVEAFGPLVAGVVTTEHLAAFGEAGPEPPDAPRPDDLGLLQFTSGSTSSPKGVMVSHRNLAANGQAIMFEGLGADSRTDTGVSWLPLYHDMGLIGFVIAPVFAQVPVVLLSTSQFVRRPSSWLETIHRHRGTISFAPNFAFSLAVQAITPRLSNGWDLSCLRVLGCGAEPINAAALRAFADKFAPLGLRAEAIMPAYGMAESTLAVTFASRSAPFRTRRCDAHALTEHRVVASTDAGAVEVVSCGRPFANHEVEVVDAEARPVPPGVVGEIVVRGPSVARGYFENAEASSAAFRNGRLFTGDLGFMEGGELYVCGRIKEMIILRGRNYFPQDIERVVSMVEGVRHAQVAAFARSDAAPAPGAASGVAGDASALPAADERLVIVAEAKSTGGPDADRLKTAIGAAVFEQLGLRVDEVHLIRRGALPKTSSGKVRRAETKNRLLTGALGSMAADEG